MKRRKFIKGMGMGSAALATTGAYGAHVPETLQGLPSWTYGSVESLDDVISQEGLVVIRIALGENPEVAGHRLAGKVKIKKAGLARIKSFFFESDEEFVTDPLSFEAETMGSDTEVIVLWLKDATGNSSIEITGDPGLRFTLGELVELGEISTLMDGGSVKAGFLLDREIGEITLADFGAMEPGNDFSFVVMADPQGGASDDSEGLKTRMKIHNAFIQESVELANKLDFDPLFTLVAGDVCDDWGYEKDLVQMNAFLSRLKSPVLYGIGNHETLLRSEFGPGYNMDPFNNFLAAQKAINGLDKLLYAFNAGMWHFVVWPDPLRTNFWETHPHYFDWLERDMEKNKERPTLVFQHVPSQPIGITPHINYAESVYVRRTFLDILARHGNVKYILSGHVHIPVKASFKTAVSYRGMKMINLPAAGYRPRSFGEEDFYGGPSQGVTVVHVRGSEASIRYKTVTGEVFDYPGQLPELDAETYALWLKENWELPAGKNFVNGSFNDGLQAWAQRYVYMEDVHPSNIRETRPNPGGKGSALYLYCRRRGYQAPGQDRLPQDVNRITQAIRVSGGESPGIRFRYRVDGENHDPGAFSGAFVLIEGYSGSNRVHKLMYSAGKIWVNNWGARNVNRALPYHHFDLPVRADQWQEATLHIAGDYEKTGPGKKYSDLKVDRIAVTLGVWTINDGGKHPFGIYFTDLRYDPAAGQSQIDGALLQEKPEAEIWWRNKYWPNVNIAGEHRYIIATMPPQP